MVLLRKSIPQNRNLKAAAELNVRSTMKKIIDQEFNRIYISRSDMEYCISFCYALKNQNDPVLQRALISSAIVSYARPFSGNKNHESANSTIKLSKLKLSESEMELHRYLLELRNTVIAHSDYEANPARALEYRSTGYSTTSRIIDPVYEVGKTESVLALAEKIRAALDAQLFQLSKKFAESEGK